MLNNLSSQNNSLSNCDGDGSEGGNNSWGAKPSLIFNEIPKSNDDFPRVRSDGDDLGVGNAIGERKPSQGRPGGGMSFFGQQQKKPKKS